jgi:hypothetical protein
MPAPTTIGDLLEGIADRRWGFVLPCQRAVLPLPQNPFSQTSFEPGADYLGPTVRVNEKYFIFGFQRLMRHPNTRNTATYF